MAEIQDMGPDKSAWKQAVGARITVDLVALSCLGAVAYLLFSHAEAVQPAEGAFLIVAAAGLLWVGLGWWDWHRGLAQDGSLLDWVQRILQGERRSMAPPQGLRQRDRHVVAALNAVIGEAQGGRADLAALREAMGREWLELDALLDTIQRHHAAEVETRLQGGARLEALGRELKTTFEDTLRLDQIELNHRLRADQYRLQGQSFRATLGQVRAGLDQFEDLLEELQDSFPRLRREEDALGLLAAAGIRQGARLALAVKGLVAHTPRLVGETQTRVEWLRRFRQSADGVRDQTEALARRIEGFREEAQARIRSFAGAQGSLKGLDHVAQETGLLAVNAAILAQRDGGSEGMAAIGGRLRTLADQTAEGASGTERTLDQYRQGLERETAGLWDLQEVAQRLLSSVHELLRTAGHLDQQGHDLERALETHLGHVDQVRQASERAELSLHEIGERAMALESAHGRQWGVEAKIAPERERLSRLGTHLAEVGEDLARISQKNIDEVWDILARHQEIRRAEAYRQVTSGELPRLLAMPDDAGLAWNRIAWARAQRRPRLAETTGGLPPMGRRDPDGAVRLLLLGQDALDGPEPSALESCSCDALGRVWDLRFLASLRTESHRLALLELLKESPLTACFPGLDMRISTEGAQLRLPSPYPGLPGFLAGLGLELPVEPGLWGLAFRPMEPRAPAVQRLIWIGPAGGGRLNQSLRLVHAWVKDDPQHESFLPWLPYEGPRPPCPLLQDSLSVDKLTDLAPVRCLGLGADPALLNPMRDRLLVAGASEGPGGLALCAISLGHPHPEALLLRLFQQDADLAGAFHPDLVPYQARLRDEVLGGSTGDPWRASWSLLEDLQREGWVMPLPPA
ncbi:MAG: methyl-accepting chemotaxis protein [Geothrix sp.]|nr:methyl-accepting chemotaxis protein [Geothrix sp.]